jgi:hypothetical protein
MILYIFMHIHVYIYKMYDILYTYPLYIYIQQVFHPFEAQRCDRFTAQRWPAFHATKSSMADHGINSDPAWNWKATGALYILYRDIHISYLHTYIYIVYITMYLHISEKPFLQLNKKNWKQPSSRLDERLTRRSLSSAVWVLHRWVAVWNDSVITLSSYVSLSYL